MNLSGPIGNIARWALKQTLGTLRGNAAIALLEGPIGALVDALVLHGRGTIELDRLNQQARRMLEDMGRGTL